MATEMIADRMSVEEIADLILRVMGARAPEPVHQDELERIVGWVQQVRVDQTLLQLVMEQRISIHWSEGADEPTFRSVVRS